MVNNDPISGTKIKQAKELERVAGAYSSRAQDIEQPLAIDPGRAVMTASVSWSNPCTTGHAQALPTWVAGLQGRDVVVVSPQYWGDYWVSKHWIAYELSRQLRTAFIEPPVWVGGVLKHAWTHRAHIRGLLQPMRRVDRNLHVLTPRLLPGNNMDASLHAANQRTVETLQRAGIRRPIVLNFGTNFDLVKRLNGAPTVYYCVDPPVTDAACADAEVLTCGASDLIYAVSEAQRARLAALSPSSRLHLIPHGYAFQHARRIAEDASISCPRELRDLPRPVLGFVGSIHDAFVDIDRVEQLARRFPQSSVVLLGPYRNNPLGPDLSSKAHQRLRQLPNVHLLGPRHFLDVPRYVKYFDVCLVLVNLKDYDQSAMTKKRAHFKWLIYLSMGKPVVSPRVDEVDSISSLVYLASDEAAYFSAIEQALREEPAAQTPRIRYASQLSFDKTLERIAEPIARFLRSSLPGERHVE